MEIILGEREISLQMGVRTATSSSLRQPLSRSRLSLSRRNNLTADRPIAPQRTDDFELPAAFTVSHIKHVKCRALRCLAVNQGMISPSIRGSMAVGSVRLSSAQLGSSRSARQLLNPLMSRLSGPHPPNSFGRPNN